jgi:nucleotide-binding universal stress UspA family protein
MRSKENPVYKKILVPTDGSETAAKAIAPAVQLAGLCKASVVGVTVSDPYPYAGLADAVPMSADAYRASTTKAAEDALQPLLDACQAAGVACECVVCEDVHPWKAALDTGTEKGCDVIVMASHGRRGVQAVLLGSETQKVLTHSHLPVLVVR